MPILEKKPNLPEYVPVADDESSEGGEEVDGLIFRKSRPVASFMKRFWQYSSRFTVVLLYSVLIIGATSAWWHHRRYGPNVIDSPLAPYVKYEPKFFHKMDTQDYKMMGPPGPEVDARWNELTQFFFTEFPYEDMKKLGREHEAIQLPNGKRLWFLLLAFTYTVDKLIDHSLDRQFCGSKRLHQSRYRDYYFPNITEDEKIKGDKHDMHCLEDLIEEVMCHADVAPYTTRWYQKDPRPTGNSDIAHQCVNWEMLRAELKRKHVDPWEPGLLVHPVFGPVVTHGKDTVFPKRMGFPSEFIHVGETEEEYHERVDKLGILRITDAQ